MTLSNRKPLSVETPFNLDNDDLYRQWRDAKLTGYPETLGELLVEINDPRKLTDIEPTFRTWKIIIIHLNSQFKNLIFSCSKF